MMGVVLVMVTIQTTAMQQTYEATQKNWKQELGQLLIHHNSLQRHSRQPEGATKTKCPSTREWANEMRYVCICKFVNTNNGMIYTCTHIHTMEHYTAIKRNGVLTHATTSTNLGNTMLSKRNQTRRDKYCKLPLT